MKSRKIIGGPPPYPRLGEVYRTISGALDTKAGNRSVDRLAREGEFDWSLLPSLGEDLIFAPLRKQIDPEFAELIKVFVTRFHSDYLGLVSTVPLDGLRREDAMPLLVEYYFSYLGMELINQIREKFGGPDLMVLLEPDCHRIAVVLDWYSDEGEESLAKTAYFGSTGSDKRNREMVARWATGNQLPDLASIKLFATALEARGSPEQKARVPALGRWLIIARALTVLETKSPVPFSAYMRRYLLDGFPAIDIGHILSTAVLEAGKRFSILSLPALTLYESLNRTTVKQPGDQAKTKAAFEAFERLTEEHDPEGCTQFHLEWMHGRWHALSGLLEDALPYYQAAAELAIYRAGKMQKNIIEEALVLAAHLGKKAMLKQLKHRAIAFGLFSAPHADDPVDDWEIGHLSQQFHRIFPTRGRFPESCSAESNLGQLPFLVIDMEKSGQLKPDLARVDRVIAVRSVDGQARRWPQLHRFASLGNDMEVDALLSHGAAVDQLDEANGSALLCAIQHATGTGNRKALDRILQNPHRRETLDSSTARKQLTPLICAVEYGEPDVVERLLVMGASSDRRGNIVNATPLYLCMGKLGIVGNPAKLYQHLSQSMLADGDLVHQEVQRRYNVSFAGVFGDSQTLHALLEDSSNRELFEKLLVAMVNEQLARYSVPKLVQIAELLLISGANPNAAHTYPASGRTPLMLAAENNAVLAFDLLLQHHGDPYQRDAAGLDCAKIATGFGANDVVRYLRSRGIR
jgi:hypothetical protein